jgi:Metallopeptidase family M24
MMRVAEPPTLDVRDEHGLPVRLHSAQDFIGMRKAGALAAACLDYLTPLVKADITTDALNALAHNFVLEHGGVPAPLYYRGFPKSICTSINHVVCHGIPSPKRLKEGDIVNIDVTVVVEGWHGDTSRMFYVGDVPLRARRLALRWQSQATRWAILGTPSKAMQKKSAILWLPIFAATAWARCSTTPPRLYTPANQAKGWCCARACFLPSSR